MRPRHLDVSDLEPPQPLVRALAALQQLADDEYLVLRHRREPLPLYGMLAPLGFVHRTTAAADGHCEIRIWRAPGPAPGPES